MKTTLFLRRLKPMLVLIFAYGFAFTATAQNYYPAHVGNTWVLENTDIQERRIYSLEAPDTSEDPEVITLKIEIEELDTGDIVDTDKYFLTVGSEDIKLHGTILEEGALGTVTTNFPTPATFFPLNLTLGDQWQIIADAKVKLDIGLEIGGESTTNLEVVGFEDLETPAGTFQNCAKVKLALQFSAAGGFINIDISDSITYQWLAPEVGPVQYQNSDGEIFQLVSFELLTVPDEPDTTEEDMMPEQPTEEDPMSEMPSEPAEPSEEETMPEPEETMPEPVPYDVTGDGVVNILDLTFVASHFGESDPEADVNSDGIVNILDLVLVAQNFSR